VKVGSSGTTREEEKVLFIEGNSKEVGQKVYLGCHKNLQMFDTSKRDRKRFVREQSQIGQFDKLRVAWTRPGKDQSRVVEPQPFGQKRAQLKLSKGGAIDLKFFNRHFLGCVAV
jgi:hypothetical protein